MATDMSAAKIKDKRVHQYFQPKDFLLVGSIQAEDHGYPIPASIPATLRSTFCASGDCRSISKPITTTFGGNSVMKLLKSISLAMAVLLLTVSLLPAQAQTGKGADTDTEPATIVEIRATPTPEPGGIPFSVPGNGEVLDDISDDSKEFYIITTQNNNTFYLVIDKANSSQNVYMLSKVDENDLKEFIESDVSPTPTPTPAPTVIMKQPDITPVITDTSQTDTGTDEDDGVDVNKLIILAAVVVFGLLFYFKFYKKKKNTAEYDEEGIEQEDE